MFGGAKLQEWPTTTDFSQKCVLSSGTRTDEVSIAQLGEISISGTGCENGEERFHIICKQTSLYTPKQKFARHTLVLPVHELPSSVDIDARLRYMIM